MVPGVDTRIDAATTPMKILAIDASGEPGSIAITEGERVMEEIVLPAGDGFAHVLFGEIEKLLARHELKISDIDGFASDWLRRRAWLRRCRARWSRSRI
jgi:hypothetical protein